MALIHDLSEGTKHTADIASAITPVASGAAAVLTLSNAALVTTILAALCSIAWFVIRLYDRIRYGPSVNE